VGKLAESNAARTSLVARATGARSVVIMGGGMGGLASALALKQSGYAITIVERDPAPPEIEPSEAFESWKRAGVPQLRHTHIFLARLQSILRAHHPEFLAELAQQGIVQSSMDQLLPATQAGSYVPQAGDRDLQHLWGRRATFEYALRRYLQRLGNVEFVHDASVEALICEPAGAALRVTGVELKTESDTRKTLTADVVIDCSGRRSKTAEQLRALGAQIRGEEIPSQCGYYCRHYVQRSELPEPPRRGTGASLDYLVYGMFFAEQNTFSIAIACPDIEAELLARLRRPEGFDEVCEQIPVLRTWLERSEPISRVLGGAELANRWNHFPKGRGPHVLGYFPVGDAYMQTNPIYGRGCSSAFVQAHALAQTLAETLDPEERARHYHRSVWRLLRPHFDFCVAADRAFLARARLARGESIPFSDRLVSYVYEAAFLPALEESSWVARQWLKAQQMCELAPPWVGLGMLMYILCSWPLRRFTGPRALPARGGPPRSEMLRACLPADAGSEDAG
jgi:2-polyprenyl-6-methoxyphenol hydroxylase-like FAD-dependent oxidoreductase